jgi:sec-independent protein translocase protein TatC
MAAHDKEDELAGTEQPFVSHLIELRDRLAKALIAVVVAGAALALWPGPGQLYDFLAAPLIATLPQGATLIATSVISPFLVPLKILMMAAFLMALPIVLYQVWAFVAPGLYNHEKRLVLPLVVSSTLLFFVGVAFCYYFVFGQVFKFIQSFAPKSITAAPDIEAYLSFVLTMFLAFGLAFEVPIVVVVLARLGLVTIEKLKSFRSYFIVLAFIIAAVVTPPDVVSQLALAIPMCILYEVGIVAAQFFMTYTKAPEEPAEGASDRPTGEGAQAGPPPADGAGSTAGQAASESTVAGEAPAAAAGDAPPVTTQAEPPRP